MATKQQMKWLPPTDHKHIEWESVALIGFDGKGWPQTICTIEPKAFLDTLKHMALTEINDGRDEEEDEEDWLDEDDCELSYWDICQAEQHLRWALYPVEVAKEIFCSAREERKKEQQPVGPPKPLPGQLTLPIPHETGG